MPLSPTNRRGTTTAKPAMSAAETGIWFVCCTLGLLISGCSNIAPLETTPPKVENVENRVPPSPAPASEGRDKRNTGVKNSQNVPSFTRTQLAKKYAAQRACISKCVESRQMQAVSHETIRQECTQGCMKTHFVGQVGVIPDPKVTQEDEKTDASK